MIVGIFTFSMIFAIVYVLHPQVLAKDEQHNTDLALYMSKTIIEEHLSKI